MGNEAHGNTAKTEGKRAQDVFEENVGICNTGLLGCSGSERYFLSYTLWLTSYYNATAGRTAESEFSVSVRTRDVYTDYSNVSKAYIYGGP